MAEMNDKPTDEIYTSHCLHCRQDYAPDMQSAHCPHRALGDPREVERYARLKRKSEARTKAREAKRQSGVTCELCSTPDSSVHHVPEMCPKRRQQKRLDG